MRYVILRDDDTNAFTPPECLERLYRPFLDRGLPVNLAVIPAVLTSVRMSNGQPEGFLHLGRSRKLPVVDAEQGGACQLTAPAMSGLASVLCPQREKPRGQAVPIGANEELIQYLKRNPLFKVVQHGCHHDFWEFDRSDRGELARRLDEGTRLLMAAGFERPQTFVAPYDKLSRAAYREVARRFSVISTGWFELRRLPFLWWPFYAASKLRRAPHWRVSRTRLLSHPGCTLSSHRSRDQMLETIKAQVNACDLTVVVTHWWEYFRDTAADEPFIQVLHQVADLLASRSDVRVISFSDLTKAGAVPKETASLPTTPPHPAVDSRLG